MPANDSTNETETMPINEAMKWGSMCEDHAVATYINGMPCKKFEKTGLWVTRDRNGAAWLGVSPDGIVDSDTVVEIKCPYMGGNPFPYRKVPVLYVPQCQLEMYSTNTQKCHFVCWTPRKTVIFLVKRDEQFIKDLLIQLKGFWSEAQAGKIPTWNTHLDHLKAEAQKISNQSTVLTTLTSCRSENAMEHKDFNMFWKNAQGTPTRKCQGCGKLQVLCRVNPCQKKLHSNPSSPSSSIFQSYTYGSGQMANSCYLDTFLESIYHPFIRQITPERTHFDHTTPAMDTLLESIVLCGQGSFHRSKMVLWTYLHHHTSNGRTTFPLGQMAGISNVFTALCSNMSQPEKNALFITDSVNIKCRKCNHCRNIVNTHSSYFIHHTNINIMDITDSTYDPVQVAEKVLVQQDILCSQRGICLRSNDDGSVCGGQLSHSSSVVNNPFLLVFELDKDENRPIQPGLSSKLHLRVKKDKYDLAAIIYHHNFHFWCEVFVSEKRYREGWFMYNDMWNNGKAEYVGKHPRVKTASYMYMLVFERSQVNMTTSCSKDHSASLKNIMSVAFQSNITPNAKQVKQVPQHNKA